MAVIFARRVRAGLMEISEVPELWRGAVAELLGLRADDREEWQ